jgi:hypothetical protein
MNSELHIDQHIRALEERLLQPHVRQSISDVRELLAPAFIEFGSSGRIFTRDQIIEALRAEVPVRRSLEDWKVLFLASDVILATYRASRYDQPGDTPSYSLRSSIWKLIGGRWQLVFHQGTHL